MTYREIYASHCGAKLSRIVHERLCPAALRDLGIDVPSMDCPYRDCTIPDGYEQTCAACWDKDLQCGDSLKAIVAEIESLLIDGDADEEKEVIGLVSTSALKPETLRVAIEVLVEDLGNRHRFERIADDLYRSDPDSVVSRRCLIDMCKCSVAVERALADLERYRKELEESGR